MTKSFYRRGPAITAMAVASMALAGTARAVPFEVEGWSGNWNTTISTGSTFRAQDPDSKLFKAADGARIGLSGGTGGSSSDGGTLNSKAGDNVSSIVKVVSDLELKKEDMGGVVRFKAWYDGMLRHGDMRYGNQANSYEKNAPLSDPEFGAAQKFANVQLLDAYVYNTFDVANRPLQVRLGRQVINWGESMFFQGVNQINPLDLPALRRPGAEIKEGLTPVWAADANLSLADGLSLEAFYQFAWEPTAVEGCGTYWSTMDITVGAKPGACNKITVGSSSTQAAISSGSYAPLVYGRNADTQGEYGLALRMNVEPLDTEFGVYGMNIHARTPIITGHTGSWGSANAAQKTALGGTLFPLWAAQANGGALGVKTSTAFWEYPENVQVFGLSAATTLFGWAVGAEASVIPNLPVQRNANDLLNAMLAAKGPLASIASNTASLSDISGYDRFIKTQFQLNAAQTFGGILGSANSLVAGETAFQWVNVPDYRDGTSIRYGRAFIFGTGSSSGNDTCASGSQNNPQADGCQNDGYVTQFSWGYRLRGQLDYPQFLGTGVDFKPSIYLAHDVKGVSADGQLNEGRLAIGLGSRFTIQQNYAVDLNYVNYCDFAKYDPLRDRDFASISLSASF